MINAETLNKVKDAQRDLQNARRRIDDLKDAQIVEDGWIPGHGEKPARVRELEVIANTTDELIRSLDRLWS